MYKCTYVCTGEPTYYPTLTLETLRESGSLYGSLLPLSTCRPKVPAVSLSFHHSVTQEVLGLVSKGHPTPNDIIATPDPSGTGEDDEPLKKLTIETSTGDHRLWVEILRNLTKDMSKRQSIQLPDSSLGGLSSHQPRPMGEERDTTSSTAATGTGGDGSGDKRHSALVVFSCGHAYPLERFQNRILLDFVERVQDFPLPIPLTLKQLQSYYRQAQCYPSACPHCVFQHLRKFQMEECPQVPIRPWKL